MEKTLLVFLVLISVQYAFSAISFRWCALPAEKDKCAEFVTYVNMIPQNMSMDVNASCVSGSSRDDCIEKIQNNKADLVTLDGGNIYSAGKKYNFKVIVSEQYGQYGVKYFAVAVVKKNNTGFDLKTLKGKKSCHTGAGRTAGWKVPMGYLLRSQIMPAVECGDEFNAYLSASKFFEKSCVPGVDTKLDSDVYKKVINLCELCAGTGADKCSTDMAKNQYVGYTGAFKCMADGKGDVAFVKYTTTEEVATGVQYGLPGDYEYLCPNGGRMGVGKHEECHLGSNPAHAVVTRKDNSDIDNIKKILTDMSDRYGVNQKNWNQFQLFNSSRYNGSNLIFKDSATALKGIPADQQSYMAYLGDNYGKNVEALTSCDYLSTTAAPKETLTPISASTVTSPVTAFMLFTTLLSILFM